MREQTPERFEVIARRPVGELPPSLGELPPATSRPTCASRPTVRGKFLFAGNRKLYVKGVAYGPFGSGEGADSAYDPGMVERDFAQMTASGINAVRVYTVPPRWLLDAAGRHDLLVMVGIPWEQHVAFLGERSRARAIEQRVRAAVRECAGHPALLCFAIGNEIPTPIVRWHGRRRIERFLHRLYRAAKEESPESLVTYVNYPSTEYLRLSFLDLVCFNVYLESRDRLEAYLARLQNLADESPLIIAEVGLDSRRNGHEKQAATLDWHIRSSFEAGCAGTFLFSWTDQWHRGGYEIEDWDFGLTTRDRTPKPALAAVSSAFGAAPFPPAERAPSVSVIVCTHNGAGTLRSCLEGIRELDYPDYDLIVVSDGSRDDSAQIASGYDARLIEMDHGGLGRARNAGLEAATGEIVAFIDDDAIPDPEWLTYVAQTLTTTDYAAVGGPNVLPPEAGAVEQAVSNAPGGPTHVLLSDREAEHIPGCNMAFWRSHLQAIGGFDPQFHAAGDDVDVCWQLQAEGLRLGFNPGAVVWHHRRRSVRAYLKQQHGYGKAEALLERKWPDKYSPAGHVTWSGRLYGNGSAQHRGGRRWRIYYGGWGTGLFQSIYGPRSSLLESLPLMPEWYLAILALTVLSALGALWPPLLLTLPFLVLALGALIFDAGLGGARAVFQGSPSRQRLLRLRVLTAALYLLQPLARLGGRLAHGLTPWRRHGPRGFAFPRRGERVMWSEHPQPTEQRLHYLQQALSDEGAVALSGGDWDRWDLEVRGGSIGVARVLTALEEHGGGRQLFRVAWWPHVSTPGAVLSAFAEVLAIATLLTGNWSAAAIFGSVTLLVIARLAYECGAAGALVQRVVARQGKPPGQ
jgi:GT2 family glycosyltransferase